MDSFGLFFNTELDMTSKRGRPPSSTSDPAIAARVIHLLDVVFLSNQHRAAEALEVSQAYLSKIIRRERHPGTKVLEALLRFPKVNKDWLLRGEGQPLIASTAGTLPVSTSIIPGPLQSHMLLCSGARYPIAAALERETRYWLKLAETLSRRFERELCMLPNDHLLVETHKDHIERPDIVRLHLCAIAVKINGAIFYGLGRVTTAATVPRAEFYGDFPEEVLDSTPDVGSQSPKTSPTIPTPVLEDWKPPRRAIGRLRAKQSPQELDSELGIEAKKPNHEVMRGYPIHCILGVVLRLERPYLPLPANV